MRSWSRRRLDWTGQLADRALQLYCSIHIVMLSASCPFSMWILSKLSGKRSTVHCFSIPADRFLSQGRMTGNIIVIDDYVRIHMYACLHGLSVTLCDSYAWATNTSTSADEWTEPLLESWSVFDAPPVEQHHGRWCYLSLPCLYLIAKRPLNMYVLCVHASSRHAPT